MSEDKPEKLTKKNNRYVEEQIDAETPEPFFRRLYNNKSLRLLVVSLGMILGVGLVHSLLDLINGGDQWANQNNQGVPYPTRRDQLTGFYRRLLGEIEFIERKSFPDQEYLDQLSYTELMTHTLQAVSYKQSNND